MSAPPPTPERRRAGLRALLAVVFGGGALAVFVLWGPFSPFARNTANSSDRSEDDLDPSPRELGKGRRLTVWWDALPADVRDRSVLTGEESNIHPPDYAGPESCKKCHSANYASWAKHPHRWMNALASDGTVKGDFSGSASISYRGGQASFSRQGDRHLMRLERDGLKRTYAVTQTIGSRFFQYYVGRQIEGPEPRRHHFYTKDHVLPFGYWLDQKEWVPVVHIGPEVADWQRPDPFEPPDRGQYYAEYAVGCNSCHTTFPLGDLFGRRPQQTGEHAPVALHWSMRKYLEETHPDMAQTVRDLLRRGVAENPMLAWEAPKYAATLGVSCEACHLGAKAHVESGGRVLPKFFPESPHLFAEAKGKDLDFGRSHDNVNWACGRCHTGPRPQFAAGMSTWNSVEYADAVRGNCYSKLRCIDCHNPHRQIGPKWTPTADQDDAVCLKCHGHLRPAEKRQAHTHHPAGSEGARCLNCHMPRINEGLQDIVRTHMIYSPTRADMIEANHPNACNLCHTDRPIDWTLSHLKQWYGATYDEKKTTASYPDRARPVALGWLGSRNAAVRLVAVDALTRARDHKALPQLLDALDDEHLVNRQFAAKGLQEMLNVRLVDFGYRFYMTSVERRQPLTALRAKFSQRSAPKSP